jgi:YjbE family integral membrane protein
MDLSSGAVWGALGAIIAANVVLSGDNAVVIAMVARSLPPHRQRLALWWGSTAAIVLRIALTIGAVQALQLPYLKIAGAVALLWIGVQLLIDSEAKGDVKAQVTLFAAIRTILVADLVMSIDNVIAVAGAADSAPADARVPLLVVGLATSIPLIIAGSTFLMKVLDRFPIIMTLGAALLGSLAGQMLVTDPAWAGWFAARVPVAGLLFGAGGAMAVVVAGKWLHLRARRMNAA